MTAPNIVGVTVITGKTVTVDLTTTNATAITSNAAASGKVFKINSLYVANIDTSTNISVTVNYYSAAAIGGTAIPIASTVAVPANSTLVVISKDSSIYLEEDKSIGATAGTSSKLKIICSYEEIS